MSTCTKCHEEKPAEEFYLFTKSGTERRKQCMQSSEKDKRGKSLYDRSPGGRPDRTTDRLSQIDFAILALEGAECPF